MNLNAQIIYVAWLLEVEDAIPSFMLANLSRGVLMKLAANILAKAPLETAAKDVADQMASYVLKEWSNVPKEVLINWLAKAVAEDLASASLENWTAKLIERFAKKSAKDMEVWPETLSPREMAEYLVENMTEQFKEETILVAGENAATLTDKVRKSIVNIATLAVDMILREKQ